ncbi:MAG: rod shape-determining protein MreC [Gammaproteobacteria bacterium]|nr:rod shape-determining protein MreC [Gammaproteobacteria bacterium]
MLALAISSTLLLIVGSTTRFLDPVRGALLTVVSPLYFVAEIPYVFSAFATDVFSSRDTLLEEKASLADRVLELSAVAQRYDSLQAENERLRELLGSTSRLPGDVLVAELVTVIANNQRHEVIIDKGSSDGVAVGQPVIDASGLFGQVVEVGAFTSRVLLISDGTHAVPVQVNRNDVRAIAAGTGAFARLELENVPVTADIREGDLMVSSGLGGRFPRGYPVGRVVVAINDNAAGVKRVEVRPSAALDRTRHVLIVFESVSQRDPGGPPNSPEPSEPVSTEPSVPEGNT